MGEGRLEGCGRDGAQAAEGVHCVRRSVAGGRNCVQDEQCVVCDARVGDAKSTMRALAARPPASLRRRKRPVRKSSQIPP